MMPKVLFFYPQHDATSCIPYPKRFGEPFDTKSDEHLIFYHLSWVLHVFKSFRWSSRRDFVKNFIPLLFFSPRLILMSYPDDDDDHSFLSNIDLFTFLCFTFLCLPPNISSERFNFWNTSSWTLGRNIGWWNKTYFWWLQFFHCSWCFCLWIWHGILFPFNSTFSSNKSADDLMGVNLVHLGLHHLYHSMCEYHMYVWVVFHSASRFTKPMRDCFVLERIFLPLLFSWIKILTGEREIVSDVWSYCYQRCYSSPLFAYPRCILFPLCFTTIYCKNPVLKVFYILLKSHLSMDHVDENKKAKLSLSLSLSWTSSTSE